MEDVGPDLFDNLNVNLPVLRERAYNYRWAEVPEDVIPLTSADPDFPAAPEIREALIDYVSGGYFSYAPKKGLPEFIRSIAFGMRQRKDEILDEEMILPIDSAARGMFITTKALLKPGDEVIVFDPVDYLFKESVLAAGAVPVYFPAKVEDGRIDVTAIGEYITGKTRMISLCNPHNPLGTLYSRDDLELILSLAETHDLYIMNDEIWSDIVYDKGAFTSILSLDPERNGRVVTVYGFSKAFGVAGLRIGCLYCYDQDVFGRIVATSEIESTAGGISSLSQVAGIACMTRALYWIDAFVDHCRAMRDYAVQRINKMPGLSCSTPEATYLLFIDISKTGLPSQEFVDTVLTTYRLALVPGVEKFFGPGAAGYVRLCFATSKEILTEGLDRLERAVNDIMNGKNTLEDKR